MLNPADPVFLADLAAQVPEGCLRQPEPRDLDEPRGRWQGVAGAVARPRSTAEVAQIVRICAAARVGIVPMGGGTGLVGGQIMERGPMPLILSLERMNRLRGVYPDENVILVEAGMILADVHALPPVWRAPEFERLLSQMAYEPVSSRRDLIVALRNLMLQQRQLGL